MRRQEYHFILVYDTERRKWTIADPGDYLSEGCVWDKDLQDWVDWDVSYSDADYKKKRMLLNEILQDFNIFSETYPVDTKSEI